MDSCIKHSHEPGVAICRRCGGSWCSDCLVYAFGPKKPPFCLGCAMVAGGVRTVAARPAMPKRELKARQKAAKAEAKAAQKAARKQGGRGSGGDQARGDQARGDQSQGDTTGAAPAVAPSADPVPDGPATDWDQPWWESSDQGIHTLVD